MPYPLDFANRLATAYADAMEILREHARKDEDVIRHLRKLAATATELADLLEKEARDA